jgi:phospholipid-binding lipoprotein MlaA
MAVCLLLVQIVALPVIPTAAAADLPAEESEAFDDEDLEFLEEDLPADISLVSDPFESFNRDMFALNDTLYFALLKPLARGYGFIIPADVRICLRNFFNNLLAPVRIVNCALQGKWAASGGEVGALFINSTVGVLGFGDPAARYPGLNPPEEDFGQTLAVWGIGNGPYLVIPVIGFSTTRDFAGWFGDRYLDPLWYTAVDLEILVARVTVKLLNDTSFRIGDYEAVKAAAIDPYVAFRNGYIQFRLKKIQE